MCKIKDFDKNNLFREDELEGFFNLFNLGLSLKEISFRMEIDYNTIHKMFMVLRLRNKKNYTDLPNEVWKSLDFIGYPMFFISNLGRLRRATFLKKLKINQMGYYEANLYHLDKVSTKMIHRLVALAFIENPLNKETVNHKDYDRLNNNVSNLEWLTYQENNNHRDLVTGRKEEYSKRASGSNNPRAKLTEEIVLDIRSEENKHLSNKELGEKFNIRQEHARTIRKRIKWKHI